MQGSLWMTLAIVAIAGVTIVLVAHILFGGPDPQAGSIGPLRAEPMPA